MERLLPDGDGGAGAQDGVDVIVAGAEGCDRGGGGGGEGPVEVRPGAAREKLKDAGAVGIEGFGAEGDEIEDGGEERQAGEEGEGGALRLPGLTGSAEGERQSGEAGG